MDRQARPGARDWGLWLLLLTLTAVGAQWRRESEDEVRTGPTLDDEVLGDVARPRIVFPAHADREVEPELGAHEAQ